MKKFNFIVQTWDICEFYSGNVYGVLTKEYVSQNAPLKEIAMKKNLAYKNVIISHKKKCVVNRRKLV